MKKLMYREQPIFAAKISILGSSKLRLREITLRKATAKDALNVKIPNPYILCTITPAIHKLIF